MSIWLSVTLTRIMKADLEGLATAADVVAKGGVICYPTDTLYGLGCDPLNVPAIQKTMKAKGDRTKPMPILVRSLEDADKLAHVSERARRLADKFWPGPLTMILQARGMLPRILVPEGTIGLRSPKHPICLNLLGLCSGMLVGTSANLTGRPPATSAKEALDELGGQVDVILDGGRSPLASASTVVDLTRPKLVILREGPVGREELFRCVRSHA
jgi:L-threonylcarbamoyladenylate synthase